ncbi:MAG: hypothetical protein H7224_09100 [Polaromonas sp.]|nr:hypothetical protein [Polaromonas sp.]
MTPVFKSSIPAAATLALALMFGAQAQAQTPMQPAAQATSKGDQMAPPAPGGTSDMSGTAPATRMPQANNVTNGATTPVTKAKKMTMEERNESRTKREDAATNGGTTSPAANNITNGAMTADPQAMAKKRAERKAERDAKRMAKSGMAKPEMDKSGMMAKPGMDKSGMMAKPAMADPAMVKP